MIEERGKGKICPPFFRIQGFSLVIKHHYLEELVAETEPIARIATKVSKEVFKWFRWERVSLEDQNFKCRKQQKHAPTKRQEHTHPVDVIFKYDDPYKGQTIIFNTDLKSYKKESIQPPKIRSALKSMAQTIDCARVSPDWRQKYDPSETADVRGLLFVYNHDAEYDGNFSRFLVPPKPSTKKSKEEDEDDAKGLNGASLPIEAGQMIHIVEPRTIAYMTTIIADANRLHTEGTFPQANYYFYYPELKLHKTHGSKSQRPATIEMITGPFLIVEHDQVRKLDEATDTVTTTCLEGIVIFYNRAGNTHFEFLYLFDLLSSYQMLDGEKLIRIRVLHYSPHRDIRSNFHKAIEAYIHDWGFDDYKRDRLQSIEFEVVEIQKTSFSQEELGWDRGNK